MRWLTIPLAGVLAAFTFFMSEPIPFWRGGGATAILTSLAIIAAAAFVRLARPMPAIPNEIADVASVKELALLFNQSVRHMRLLLLMILISLVYVTIIPSIYAPLEKIGVSTKLAENLPSSIGFFVFFCLLGETWRALSLDQKMACIQANLAQQAVASRAITSSTPSSSAQ